MSSGASFDPALAHDCGRVLAAETRAPNVDVLHGPAMDIVRVPQGGRNFEYFSEDPHLTGQPATSRAEGSQSQMWRHRSSITR